MSNPGDMFNSRTVSIAILSVTLIAGILTAGRRQDKLQAVTPPTTHSEGTYTSEGKQIAYERFEPKKEGKYPLVLFLHGADGFSLGGSYYRDAARQLAAQGYVVFFVHYFDRTGTTFADGGTILVNFLTWLKTVNDGMTFARKQPGVDPEKNGVLGISLGASLALSVGASDPKVKAVVEYFGGMTDVGLAFMKRMPPTLILHGDMDLLVPVSNAERLEHHYKANKLPYEIHIYKGQGHGFTGDAGKDSAERTLAFFNKHLKGEK